MKEFHLIESQLYEEKRRGRDFFSNLNDYLESMIKLVMGGCWGVLSKLESLISALLVQE